ncbi:MAG: phage head closure protein [Rickettsiaceae bacterium]|nr:phage head closure protein [Rickettsiaceae bacterium]
MQQLLRHKVFFLKNKADNENNIDNWQPVFTSFVAIDHLAGGQIKLAENLNFSHLISENYFCFTMRYLQAVNQNLRIEFNDRIFSIKRIINEKERNQILKLICLELGSKGEIHVV